MPGLYQRWRIVFQNRVQRLDRGITVYGYFNNHYAGYAIGSIEQFREMWHTSGPAASGPS